MMISEIDSDTTNYFQWRIFTPTFCLQLAVFGFCIYYDLLAVISIYVGLLRLSSTPSTSRLSTALPVVVQVLRVSGGLWIGCGVLLSVIAILGKVAARSSSRSLLATVSVAQLLLTIGLAVAAAGLQAELSAEGRSGMFWFSSLSPGEAEILGRELPKLIQTAGGIAGSIALGCIVSFALLIVLFRRKHSSASQYAYANLMELN